VLCNNDYQTHPLTVSILLIFLITDAHHLLLIVEYHCIILKTGPLLRSTTNVASRWFHCSSQNSSM